MAGRSKILRFCCYGAVGVVLAGFVTQQVSLAQQADDMAVREDLSATTLSSWHYEKDFPIFRDPSEIFGKNQPGLIAWCDEAEQRVSEVIRQQDDWTSIHGTYCCFLVSSDGKIESPLLITSKNKRCKEFVLAALSKVENIPKPPSYFTGRWLAVYLAYPKIRFLVNQKAPSTDQEFFAKLRRRQ